MILWNKSEATTSHFPSHHQNCWNKTEFLHHVLQVSCPTAWVYVANVNVAGDALRKVVDTRHISSVSLRCVCEIEKVSISFVIGCVSVRMEQLGSDWRNCHEIRYLSTFRKSIKKIHLLLKSDKNNEYFTWRRMYIYYNISLSSCQNKKCFGQNCRENKTHLMFDKFFPPKILLFTKLSDKFTWRFQSTACLRYAWFQASFGYAAHCNVINKPYVTTNPSIYQVPCATPCFDTHMLVVAPCSLEHGAGR